MKSHSPITYEKSKNSLFQHNILSITKFIRFKNKNKQQKQQQKKNNNNNKRTWIHKSIYNHLRKTNSFNLEISSIDEGLSKITDYNLVSKKKTSAGLDSIWMLTREPIDDPQYFSISDRDKNLSEQLIDDSQGIPETSQVNTVPPINTSILNILAEFITEIISLK